MKLAKQAVIGLLAVSMTAPLQAQDRSLSENQVELYSEMLAMSTLCTELRDFEVQSADVQRYVNLQLEGAPESDAAAVQARSDTKFNIIRTTADNVRNMQQGSRRTRAVNAHIAQMMGRCNRLAEHRQASTYFLRR